MKSSAVEPLLAVILGEKCNDMQQQAELVYYEVLLPARKIILGSAREPELGLWRILFEASHVVSLAGSQQIESPLTYGSVEIGKADLLWIFSRLTGFKKVPPGKTLSYVYTRLFTNYLKIAQIFKILPREEVGEVILNLLSESKISFQMLYTLFELLEQETSLSSFLSERAYQTLKDEISNFSSALQGNKAWEKLTEFLGSYLLNGYLNEKNKLPVLQNFLKELQKEYLKMHWPEERIINWVLALLTNKELLPCFSEIPDGVLSRAFAPEGWNSFSGLISVRTLKRLQEDGNDLYRLEDAFLYQLKFMRKVIEYLIGIKPPFFYLNKADNLAGDLNLLFDLTGPLNTAIFFQEQEILRKELLGYFSPFRKAFIEMFIAGRIQKQSRLTRQESQRAQAAFHFYVAAAQILPDLYFML